MKSTIAPNPAAAERIVKDAGKLFRKYFKRGVSIDYKNGDKRNIVTSADRAIERFITQRLQKHYPNHSILGEEFGLNEIKNSTYKWLIDPIDGTTNFCQGIPYCAITVALLKNLKPIWGIVSNPISNDVYIAKRGEGAYHNNKRININKVSDPIQAFGAVHWGKNYRQGAKLAHKFILKTKKIRVNGCVALSLCEVAAGHYDFFISSGGHLNTWDIAAGVIIVNESGGVNINSDGKDLEMNKTQIPNAISANKQLAYKLAQIIKK